MKQIEMHCHSTLSDGKNSLNEVLAEAKRLWLDFLSLTDHDTISPQEFQRDLGNVWIQTCDSVEISARNNALDKSLHLVSYAKMFHQSLHEVLENSRKGKLSMKKGQLDTLIQKFWFLWSHDWFDTYMRVKLWREPETSNKYDMARYLMTYLQNKMKARKILWWLCTSDDVVLHFYLECLKREWAFYDIYWYEVEEYEPSVEQTVGEVAQRSWGLVSMAHPNVTFWWNRWWILEFDRTIWDYVQKWVRWVEINTMASPEWVEAILRQRQKYDLILTFWSDCHQIWYDGSDGKHASIGDINPIIFRSGKGESMLEENFERFQGQLWI